ncbi:MAG: geranylgeranylglycerol-phosphate geranylgeranyltransferase [Thaumarchaeota archaeon]|nr:geranylgeranylglycerol-phosphate geranylgeranyltransferase [Candidatus Geocrenenecus arthurdayi]MCL7389830.1 geranylgeranylglycerol-phosphate geranylgeranyltransferase [Candidatus Geocrenenecus arthurdayi]
MAGVAISYSKIIRFEDFVYSFIVAYTLNGSSMVLNDYFDRDVDRVNAPHRPIPSGLIKPSHAVIYSSILGLTGIIFSRLISIYCMIIAIISYLAAFTYNSSLKKTGLIGNFIVSLIVSAPFIFGATMSDGYISDRIIVFIIPVILSNTGREVIKGIADVEGDIVRRVNSIARVKGAGKAALAGSILYLLAVLFSPVPYILGCVSEYYLPIVLIADVGFIISARKIMKRPDKENAIKVKNETLLWMFIALIAYILGGIL